MDRDHQDAPFTTWFRELRADDARRIAPAHHFLDAVVTRKPGRLRRSWALPATAAALTVAVGLLLVFWTAPFSPRGTPATQLGQWQPPTAQLLHPFGEELLSKTPQLLTPLPISNETARD